MLWISWACNLKMGLFSLKFSLQPANITWNTKTVSTAMCMMYVSHVTSIAHWQLNHQPPNNTIQSMFLTSNSLFLTSIYIIQAVFPGRNSPNVCKHARGKFSKASRHAPQPDRWPMQHPRGAQNLWASRTMPKSTGKNWVFVLFIFAISTQCDHPCSSPTTATMSGSLMHDHYHDTASLPPHVLSHLTTTTPPAVLPHPRLLPYSQW
jgi:hypothetical protein